MNWKAETKQLLAVVCIGVVLYCALTHLNDVAGALVWVVEILTPFLLGGAIAFVLNVPMRAIEKRLPHRGSGKNKRLLALTMTLVLVLGVLSLAAGVIVPGVTEAARGVKEQLPGAIERLRLWLSGLETALPQLREILGEVQINWNDLSQRLIDLVQRNVQKLLTSGGGLIGDVFSGLLSLFIGIVFAFYILAQKENLARQGRQCLYALLPERAADRTLSVLALAERTFTGFLSGQCLEAVILGTMFVVVMTMFHLPYALLVGVLIALTALIPIVGALIGCGIGALLIAVSDPWAALGFTVLFVILQQIEGNLIYPRVVGSSVGLPAIWVLFAVSVGGSLLGIVGILLFIPLASVCYALFRSFVRERLEERRIDAKKWE